MKEVTINTKYKDSVFRMLFNSKEELLSLYNAVNGTHYDNAEDLEINTLEEGVFLNMKNDVSFVFRFELNLYEHQSTKCGNMSLRFLYYVSDLLAGMVVQKDLYGSKNLKIPVPRFVVFYNGSDKLEDISYEKLSNHFIKEVETPELELIVTVINVNENHNPEIMNACKTLKAYSIFVGKIRRYVKNMSIEEAADKAIDECIREDVLADFLRKNKAEVCRMSVLEYNEELHLKTVHSEGYEEGYDAAKAEANKIIAEKDARIAELEALLAEKNS
ncbi:hypothetical protein [Butyrivibrio sp. VCD2006]|uniref:hypothetical protein n=1 Tax=Butyrivibrio sp. VCD2006 TaxID=1280664 RepID=UPI0003FE9651|nr:hypothetical protein [Butyrivibrio sp. VCD2006]